MEEVGRKASARGPSCCPGDASGAGPSHSRSVCGSVCPPAASQLGERHTGQGLRSGCRLRLYPSDQKKRGEKKAPILSSQPPSACLARIIISGIICLIKIAASLTPPSHPGAPLAPNNNLDNKNDLLAGQSTAAFFLPQLARASALPSLGRGREEGARGWEWGRPVPAAAVGPLCFSGEEREPSPLPRCCEDGGAGEGPQFANRLEGCTGSPIFPPQLGLGEV